MANTATYIFADLNVRDEFVSSSTETLLYDTKVVVQSVWRLLTTEEGEIPNFRTYGLNVKKYSQYPMTEETVDEIYDYIKDRIKAFEQRAEIAKCQVDADFDRGEIYYTIYLRVKSTNEGVSLPTFTIKVGGAQ